MRALTSVLAAIAAAAVAAPTSLASIAPTVIAGVGFYNSPNLDGYTFQGLSHGFDTLSTTAPSLMTQNLPDQTNNITFSVNATDLDASTRRVVFRWEAENDRVFNQLTTAGGLTMTAIGWFIGDDANPSDGYFRDSEFVELLSATGTWSENNTIINTSTIPLDDGVFFHIRNDGFSYGVLFRATVSQGSNIPTYQDVSERWGTHTLTVTYTIPTPASVLALGAGLLVSTRRRRAGA